MKYRIFIVITMLAVALAAGMQPATATAAADKHNAQSVVEKARLTFNDFMKDEHFSWMHRNLNDAKGLLIFPNMLKGGFVIGGSGGTGVLVVRNEKSCDWTDPAFYTIGSGTLGLQIGAESAQVVIMVMSQRGIDSLLSSSLKLGGDASIAAGPVGEGAKSNLKADFISFIKAKGLYAGINLEGSVLHVRDSLNRAYYGRDVTPREIVINHIVTNMGDRGLLSAVKKSLGKCSS